MNERIAQLARDAGLISAFNAAPNRPDIEKFVELIVRECAGQVSRHAEAMSILEHFDLK